MFNQNKEKGATMIDEITPMLDGMSNGISMGIEQSSEINKLVTALSKVQGKITGAEKNAKNPHFKSDYADLHSVIESCRETLSKHGISFIQGFLHNSANSNPHVHVTTMLAHDSGQWMRTTCYLPVDRNNAQGVGSAITYGRRYGLSAMVGISQYDDDGQYASTPSPKDMADKLKGIKNPDFAKNPSDVAEYNELFSHEVFNGKTEGVLSVKGKACKGHWDVCINQTQVDQCLETMRSRIDEYEVNKAEKESKKETKPKLELTNGSVV